MYVVQAGFLVSGAALCALVLVKVDIAAFTPGIIATRQKKDIT
jgi:hypothetical protein